MVSAGQKVGLTSWTFSWTAPDPGAGTVTLHLASVDGNAAGQASDATLTDSFGDDVFIARVELKELGASSALPRPKSERTTEIARAPRVPSPLGLVFAGAVALVLVPLRRWRRKP
jgi:hypothetical protein